MPRNINLDAMTWKDVPEYGHNELGVGTEVKHNEKIFLTNDSYHSAAASLGRFRWDMALKNSEDSPPSATTEAKANEIFRWSEENLSGKWTLYEHFAYRYTMACANYVIEDEADREKFNRKWGEVFEFTAPKDEQSAPVLTEYEGAQKDRIKTSLQQAFEASSKVLPLYKGLPETWTFVAARVAHDDKLYILPYSQIGEVLCLYGGSIDKNPARHLAAILDGKNDFVSNTGTFADLVGQMNISGWGEQSFKPGEVNGHLFSLVAQGKDDGDIESYGKGDSLETFRKAYRQGRDITFHFGNAGFTFNINNPFVAYRQVENSGTAMSDGRGGLVRGEYHESVIGQYNRTSGAAEGKWTRKVSSYGGVGCGAKEAIAIYEDGRLIEGSLTDAGYDERYQPAPPKLAILGQKKAAPM
jgi:hypothetical protein